MHVMRRMMRRCECASHPVKDATQLAKHIARVQEHVCIMHTSTDAVNVVGDVAGQVVVDDDGDLLHIDAASEQIGGDEHASLSSPEGTHALAALLRVQLAVQHLQAETTMHRDKHAEQNHTNASASK